MKNKNIFLAISVTIDSKSVFKAQKEFLLVMLALLLAFKIVLKYLIHLNYKVSFFFMLVIYYSEKYT